MAQPTVADIAASFQEAVVDVLVEKTRMAAAEFGVQVVIVGGGVAANKRLREQLRARVPQPVLIPPIALCTDNGAVIAAAAHFHRERGERSGWDLDVVPGLRLVGANLGVPELSQQRPELSKGAANGQIRMLLKV